MKNLILGLLLITVFALDVTAQTWEPAIQTTIPGVIYQYPNLNHCFNISADDFGLNYIGQYGGNPGHIDYYLLDNNGVVKQNINNINSNATAASIYSYNGTVYVAVTDNAYPNHLILYAKPNTYPFSNFYELDRYTISTSQIKYMDMCADNYGLHIVFSVSYPVYTVSPIYYLNYRIGSTWAFGKVEVTNNTPGGWAGRLATSYVNGQERVHVCYGRGNEFYTRDIRIYPDYAQLDLEQSTNDWGGVNTNAQWGSIAVDPRVNGQIYQLATFLFGQGWIDGKVKRKPVGYSYNWDNNWQQYVYAYDDYKYPNSIFYDDYYYGGNYMSILYTDIDANSNWTVFQRYYDIAQGILQTTKTAVFTSNSNLYFTNGEVMKASPQGVYALGYAMVYQGAQFWMRRQRRTIQNDIVNNALWTGTTWIGSSNPINTAGANINALANSYTQLLNGTTFVINNYNRVNLYHSTFNSGNNTTIIVEPRGLLCSNSSSFTGQTHIIYQGKIRCDQIQDIVFHDSSVVELLEGANWQLDDSSRITLNGPNAVLKLNSNSEIDFGHNAKLILQNGAHIIADHAKFTSLDPNTTWDGIYLEGISNDTLKYCTIENASNGINIINKSSTGLNQPSTEISNCTFSNTTTTQLTNGVYASNSNNVLIRNNTFASSQLASGFATGIWIEYCPSGYFDIIDNNIDKVTTGITSAQSSPYIARNTITGQSGSGNGMYFDNSNGTGKYNWIYNFKKSLYGSYSSPYLLKNTFSGASDTAIDLVKSSVPLLRPINSGSTLSWLGGNNLITASSQYAGIVMRDDAYPSMDSGFNKINVGTAPYISGTVPQVLAGLLPVKYNYWTDQPPNPSQFVLQDGIAVYDPAFDGTTLPPTNYYNLNDIGFGLYDTVYVENLGDSPGAEILFMQAYQNEVQGHYAQAILLYKQVIQNYRTSDYASISLSRIFNCLEKNRCILTDYQQLQTYMNQLNINSNYSSGIRELALDFMLKSKVRQGLIASAINDYDQIYQHNLNNAKGLHALINKLSLMVMLSNGGDNPGGGQQSYEKVTEHKNSMLSLITGGKANPLELTVNSTIPKQYKLYQNYPNPFNPVTTIKYDIPSPSPSERVRVRLVVYDLLGREVTTLVNQEMKPGRYEVQFDGSNYASGLYFYRIEAGSYIEVKKMVLIK